MQLTRLAPPFPKFHGKPRDDERRALNGIIFININSLRRRDALAVRGPYKTLCNRWKRWSDKGFFVRILAGLAAELGEQSSVMIDVTYLRANRTVTNMGIKKGCVDVGSPPDNGLLANREREVGQKAA